MTSAFLLALLHLPSAFAWGKNGHEIVANIAYSRLSTEAKAAVDTILHDENESDEFGSPLAAVANWADEVRLTKEYYWTTPLHYADVKDGEVQGGCPCISLSSKKQLDAADDEHESSTQQSSCNFVYDRDSTNGKCVVGAIVDYSHKMHDALMQRQGKEDATSIQKLLRGGNVPSSHEEEHRAAAYSVVAKQSLMFLTHFVGDIHQPLHTSRASDKGGNTISVEFPHEFTIFIDGRDGSKHHNEWNLHSVWDDAIIERAMEKYFDNSQDKFQKSIVKITIQDTEKKEDLEAWLKCANGQEKKCTSQWAEESLEDALTWAYSDEHGNEVKSGAVLTEEYFVTRLKVVEKRLAAAGVRLAATLEAILAGEVVLKGQ